MFSEGDMLLEALVSETTKFGRMLFSFSQKSLNTVS